MVLDPKLSSAHTPENSPLMIARMSETIACSVSPYPMAWLTVVPPIENEHHVARGGRAGEDHRGVRVGRADAPPLVVPEDAHVHVGVALEPELLELPEVPGRGLLVAVVGVEVDGERHVGIDLRRVRNVLRDERPEVIEVEVVPAAGGVLGRTVAVISTVWLPAATPPRTFRLAVVPPYSFR